MNPKRPQGFTLDIPFAVPPQLDATMDIQIPALAWQSTGDGGYRRTLHPGDRPITIEVHQSEQGLLFTADGQHPNLPDLLRRMFPTQVADLQLGADPRLRALRRRYRGVVVMWAPPFEALVLTVLSQNRTGEIVRRVYPHLDAACHGLTPQRLADLDPDTLRTVIRSAGPYKADRLSQLAKLVAADGIDSFNTRIVDAPAAQALSYLETLPGVAHKTAACVLVFSARTSATLPVDVHLFRVAGRLGLADHDGRLTTTSRDAVINALLAHGPDTALAHFLFLLVGRTTCTAADPTCGSCFLRGRCRHAATASLSRKATP